MGVFICFAIFVITFLIYFKWLHTYWSRRGINGPTGLPFLGSFYELANPDKPRSFIIKKWTKQFGKVFGFYEGANRVLVISDMDMLQEVFMRKFDCFYARKSTNLIHGNLESVNEEPRVNLFSSRGSRWKRLRTLASPAFSVKALKKVHDVVEDSVLTMVDLMSKHADRESFNIHTYFQEYTYDVISRLAMGQPHSEQFNNHGIDYVRSIFSKTHRVIPWFLAVLFPKWEYQVKMLFFNHRNVRGGDVGKLLNFCENAVLKRIEERTENAKHGVENSQNDFIDMFLDYHSDEVEDLEYGVTIVEKKITTEDVIGSCFLFLLAGFDTTANTLGYTAYLLAKHPEKQKLVQEEIDSICQSDAISYDDLVKMRYLEAAIKESLRFYPVAVFACSRECVKNTVIGGMEIEKGTKIEADVLTLHKSKNIWGDDADVFSPERWIDGAPRHLMSWIPFGAGPRQCVGMRLGIVESKLALAHILRKYNLKTGANTENELRLQGCTTTSPEAVTLHLESRY